MDDGRPRLGPRGSPSAERSAASSAVEVRDVFGVPTFGGTVAARCRWRLDPALTRLAGSGPVHLATHVRDGSGEVVVPEGPRSRPVAASETDCAVVVPLSIPRAPGVYDVELDGVVEGRSWGSWLGIAPSVLRVERLRNGGLVWERGGTGRRHLIRWPATDSGRPFRIPHRLYGVNETERCVEIPWALSRYRGERRVLDVGYAYAEPRYLDALAALRIPFLVGIDLVGVECPGLRSLAADVRAPALRPGSFDLALALSVIEHVGRDNTRYVGARHDLADADGDLAAIRALAGLLAPGGRLLLTVPFGVAEDHGWFVQYDGRRLDRLIRASGLAVIETEFYRYRGAWQGPVHPRLLADCRYGDRAAAAAGVACVSLKRSRIPRRAEGGHATAGGKRGDGI